MVGGIPKTKTKRLTDRGEAHKRLEADHYVLYASNARQKDLNGPITMEFTYCDETPSPIVCGLCHFRSGCSFSKAERK